MSRNKSQLCWISDIHLKEAYFNYEPTETRVKSMFNKLIDTVVNIKPRVDYIIISGDVAFSGSEAEYKLFGEYFVKRLFEKFRANDAKAPLPKILTIPGNHDISWKEDKHLKQYLATFRSSESSFQDRIDFIKGHPEAFSNSFQAYSNFFSGNTEKEIGNDPSMKEARKSFFQLTSKKGSGKHIYVDPKYLSHRLFGFLVDYEREMIFVMLNTAWYSIGDNFNKLLVKEDPDNLIGRLRKDGVAKEDFEKEVVQLLDVKSRMVEFGNQIVNSESFPIKDLRKAILKSPKFTVVTIAHHPTSWLSWSELYSYSAPNLLDQPLREILNYTDILLTGHEHVPISKGAEKDSAGYSHLKAGMLMEDNIAGKTYFEHSRFSILEIENYRDGCEYKEVKYLYEKNVPRWKLSIQEGDIVNSREQRISAEREKEIVKRFFHFQIDFFLYSKLNLEKSDLTVLKEYKTNKLQVVYLQNESVVRLCFLIKDGLNSFDRILNGLKIGNEDDFVTSEMAEVAAKYPDRKVIVHFIFLDLILIGLLKKENTQWGNIFKYPSVYMEEGTGLINRDFPFEQTTEEVYNDLVLFSEQQFNNFRNEYFNYFEKAFHSNSQTLTDINERIQKMFMIVSNVRFVLDILGYWNFEKFMKLK